MVGGVPLDGAGGVVGDARAAGKAKGLLPMNADEFVGPFTSWLDVRRDCGARGDGIADDTEALQKAFNLVRPPTAKVAVVYLPSGTYRLTKTLRLERQSHGESMHLIVVGEHPETTVLRWDGEAGGVMIAADAWYSAFRRLTLDGAGKARTAVLCGPHFVGRDVDDERCMVLSGTFHQRVDAQDIRPNEFA